jgi:signal transduction histidine kinase/ligand-binding sensor domain-containing protein
MVHTWIKTWCGAVAVIALSAGGIVCARAATPTSSWFNRAYQTEDGLPDNSITGVAQTADGYLWVATKAGLSRFDGKSFAVLPRANFPAMPSRAVRAMLHDRHDRLWLGMERGPLLCLKPDGLVSFTEKDGLPGDRVVMMAEDQEGAIWVAYPNQLRRILNQQVESVALPADWLEPYDIISASDARGNIWCAKGARLGVWREGKFLSSLRLAAPVTAIGSGGKSNLWIAAGGRLFTFEEGHEPVELGPLPPKAVPSVLLKDRSGALWVGTAAAGLLRWEDQQWQKVPTSHQEIKCLHQDREGNIWAGTGGGGLNLVRPRDVALLGTDSGLPFESVLSVTEDADGRLWAAGQNGQLAQENGDRWEVLSSATNWPGGSATCVAADRRGGVWVGTRDQGLRCFRGGVWREWRQSKGLASNSVRSLLIASNGDVWVATDNPGRLQRLRDGQVLVMKNTTRLGPIRALAEAADGTIWIGTAVGEVQRVDGATLVAEPAIHEPVPLSVRCLLATADGSLWIGYAGEGLGHLKDGKYHRLTTAVGLADDFISQILPDGGGNLWIAGNRGLWRASLAELDSLMAGGMQRMRVRTYGGGDGLPGVRPSRDYFPAAGRGRDGRLWFSMSSGLLVVAPGKVHDNPLPPSVQLERVSVDDQLVAIYNAGSPLQVEWGSNVVNLRGLTAPLRLGPGHRKLEIDIAALSFSSPENVQFRYQLSGFDANWVEVGPRRRATYPRLPAGDYEFRVLACNSAGVWNETGAALALAVSPFFWETWWFKAAGVLATVLVAGVSTFLVSRRRYRRKLRRVEARRGLEQERARIARDIHDDLGASLTRISLLSQPAPDAVGNAETAAATLTQIHQTARDLTHAMGEVVWAVNPEHDTFDSLANYVSHYAQNFLRVARIHCRLEIPLQLPRQPLSAEIRHNLFLAFKEALNNVIKHAAASEVRISLKPGKAGFELLVADNGKGFSSDAGAAHATVQDASRALRGNGLGNMRSRLREIGGDCEVHSELGVGTTISFRVSLKADHGQR